MEATGQYWKPVWDVLAERGFELMLVNARHVKMVPGRKTDVADATWLAELLEHGLLRGSFVPPRVIRELRDLTRYRKRLIQAHTSEGQRIAKILEDAGIKLDSVASHLLGVSGRAMLRALIAGERDPEQLAELARGRLRNKIPALAAALEGRFAEHHAIMIGLALDHFEYLERSVVQLDERIDELMAEHSAARDRLDTIPGVGKRAAEVIIAEIGADMSVFPTAGHLASWARMCPGNNITGGKRKSGTTGGGNRWLRETLVECAWAASRQRDSYLAAQFWRLARRIGKKKAALAVGHSILVIAWHLLHDNSHLHRPRRRLVRPQNRQQHPPPRPPHQRAPRHGLPRQPREGSFLISVMKLLTSPVRMTADRCRHVGSVVAALKQGRGHSPDRNFSHDPPWRHHLGVACLF